MCGSDLRRRLARCGSWSSRTSRRWPTLLGAGSTRGGPRRRRRRRRRGRAVDGAGAAAYDAIVLDVMLPGIDGFEVCRAAARRRRLGAGADAHRARRGRRPGRRASTPAPTTTSPSRSRSTELLARLRALARRGAGRAPGRCSRSATCGSTRPAAASGAASTEIELSRQGVRAARDASCAARARCCRASTLLEHAWDGEYENRSNVVDVYVRYLREKIDRPFGRRSRSRRCAGSATGCARSA